MTPNKSCQKYQRKLSKVQQSSCVAGENRSDIRKWSVKHQKKFHIVPNTKIQCAKA